MSTIALRAWLCYSVSKCYTEGLDGYAVGLGIPLMLRLHRQQLLIHYISMTTPRHPLFLSRLCPPFAIRFFLLKSSLITTAPITDCTQDRKTSLRYKIIIIQWLSEVLRSYQLLLTDLVEMRYGTRTGEGLGRGARVCVCVCARFLRFAGLVSTSESTRSWLSVHTARPAQHQNAWAE